MLYTYRPSSVKCYLFGIELKGLSKETLLSIERVNESVTMRKAQDGSHTAFTDSVGSYRVTFHIDQTSSSNEFLHIVYRLHQRLGLNLKIPLRISENTGSGGTQFNSFETFFETEPNAEFMSDTVARQWTFICNNANYNLRGTGDRGFITKALQGLVQLIGISEAAGIDMTNIEDLIDIGIQKAEEELKNLI